MPCTQSPGTAMDAMTSKHTSRRRRVTTRASHPIKPQGHAMLETLPSPCASLQHPTLLSTPNHPTQSQSGPLTPIPSPHVPQRSLRLTRRRRHRPPPPPPPPQAAPPLRSPPPQQRPARRNIVHARRTQQWYQSAHLLNIHSAVTSRVQLPTTVAAKSQAQRRHAECQGVL